MVYGGNFMFNGLRRLKYKIINAIVESVTQNSVAEINDGIDTNEDFKKLCRKVAADSCVLLKNDNILPLTNEKVSWCYRSSHNVRMPSSPHCFCCRFSNR